MKVNRVIIFGILVFFAIGCYGKKKEYPKADIRVSYNYHNKFFRGSDGVIEKDIPFMLLVNPLESKFYCPHTEFKDSLQSTPKGKLVNDKMLHEAIRHWIDNNKDESKMNLVVYKTQLYVFKSFETNEYDVYDNVSMQGKFHYKEPIEEIEWEMTDSTKNILGYECFMAEADYHGRHWTAWFTPEIPIQNGPWKLQGLAGLILEASEPTGQHTFTATGIENSNQEMLPVYSPKEYDKASRIEILQMQRNFSDNQNSMIKAQIDLDLGPDSPQSEESKKYDFLETDYH